jgi:hypothetical protein
MSLLVIVPTRKRPKLVERFIKSFEETTDNADLLFVIDGDDDSYKDFDWHGHGVSTIDPRASVVQKLNKAASEMVDQYDQIMHLGDDCVIVTKHWDTKMLEILKDMGGSGWVYPNNKRRSDVPESWMVSSDVLREMSWFLNPVLNHYYVDNSIADIGHRSALLRYARDVVIEHKHYTVSEDTEYDELYRECEQLFGQRDMQAYQGWKASNQVPALVSKLRRKFNPDVKWVLGKV